MRITWVVVSIALSGCSSSEDYTHECHAFEMSYCAIYQRCTPGLFREHFEDLDTCAASYDRSCIAYRSRPGDGFAANMASCGTALSTATCDDWLSSSLSACNAITGGRADGESCEADEECASGFCSDTGCGRCAPAPGPGQACGNHCVAPLVCLRGICIRQGVVGSACTDNGSCSASFLACDAGKCVPLPRAGEPCNGPLCDVRAGDVCVDGTCVTPTLSKLGGPCSLSQKCIASTCVKGVCQTYKEVGEHCDFPTECREPAFCNRSTCVLTPACAN